MIYVYVLTPIIQSLSQSSLQSITSNDLTSTTFSSFSESNIPTKFKRLQDFYNELEEVKSMNLQCLFFDKQPLSMEDAMQNTE